MAIYLSLLFLMVLVLYFDGHPKKWTLNVERLLDNYEYFNIKEGRVRNDYYDWNGFLTLPVLINVVEYYNFNIWGKKLLFEAVLENTRLPSGVYVALKERGRIPEYVQGHNITTVINEGSELNVILSSEKNIDEISTVSFDIKGHLYLRLFGIVVWKSEKKCSYKFLIGPKLGHSWIAFDPGTTGACVAVAIEDEQSVFVPENDNQEDLVVPSVVSFNTAISPSDLYSDEFAKEISEDLYRVGEEAISQLENNSFRTFISMKKLIGYSNSYEIVFANQKKIFVDGQLLISLLIRHLNEKMNTYLAKSNLEIEPKRAVLALPNNFTSTKIRDFILSCSVIKHFKEVRYISEAEAVLVFYIFDNKHLNKEKPIEDETVLVFDMGGSTINVTIADCVKRNKDGGVKYHLNIESQIGYSIGGDTIDFCILKTIFSEEEKHPLLKKYSPFGIQNKVPKELIYKELVAFKEEIINNFYKDQGRLNIFQKSSIQNTLIDINTLELFISRILGVEYKVGRSDSLYKLFVKDDDGEFPFLQKNDCFKYYVYKPIREAIEEAVKLTFGGGSFIDSVIFTGRSTMFPFVKEIAKSVIGNINDAYNSEEKITPNVIDFISNSELKTIVVKGAAYYALHKNSINLSKGRTRSSYGIKKTNSASKVDFSFIELIKIGKEYEKENEEGELYSEGNTLIDGTFNFDSNFVNFYQVMGSNPKMIIASNERHKFTKIGSIKLNLPISKAGVQVFFNDHVQSYVVDRSGQILETGELLSKIYISDENEEHYTWMFK